MKLSPLKSPGVVKPGAQKSRVQAKPIGTPVRPKDLPHVKKEAESARASTEYAVDNQVVARFFAADEENIPVLNRLDLQTISEQLNSIHTSRRMPTSRLAGSTLTYFMPYPVNNENRTTRINQLRAHRDSFDEDYQSIFEQAKTTRVNARRQMQDPRRAIDEGQGYEGK